MFRKILRVCGLALVLVACQSSGTAPDAIQSYLQARVEGSVDKLIGGSCSAWEAQARTEAASFASMEAKLEGVSCSAAGAEGDATLVTCAGQIVTSYNGEDRTWDLSAFTFKAVQEGGEWRMCGYK